MDVVTHTLVGVALANAGLRRKYGRGTTAVLVAASNLCDIDVVSVAAGTTTAFLVRRTVTHSVFGVSLLCVAAAYLFRRIYRQHELGVLVWLCLMGCAVHVSLDLLNAYGVALLAPLSFHRFELATTFVADPFLTGALIVPAAGTALWRLRWKGPSLETAWRVGLVLVIGYVGFCAWNRTAAANALASYVRQEGLHATDLSVIPEPLGPHRWTGIIRVQDRYRVVLVRSASGTVAPSRDVESMASDPRVKKVRSDPRALRLERLLEAPVWRADGNTVVLSDLRFSYQVVRNEWDPFRFRFRVADDRVALDDWTVRELGGALAVLVRSLGTASESGPDFVSTPQSGRP